MTYFSDYYSRLRYPIESPSTKGLRPAQLAAAHAVAAHFFSRKEPAIVVMPTGSGKTCVMMLSAFLLRAGRVLVITPSRMVREQIAENFSALQLFVRTQVVEPNTPGPKVKILDGRPASTTEWETLRDANVVVTTVQCASPEIDGVAVPPPDLFDLVLCDEAHHSPAPSWSALLASFPQARQVLFTATPFRRDEKTVRGRMIFDYPLAHARRDGVFGRIQYAPVEPGLDQTADHALALAADERLRTDRENGLCHYVMVRTSQRARAGELAKLYAERTKLRLQTVLGSHSQKHLKSTIKKMRDGELDGVICVDMLGEGFDLPNLKIAVLHSPHKSLNVTLQFIGRFARTTAPNAGHATFLAVPSEIEMEATQLYKLGAEWNEIVEEASRKRIETEKETRDVIATFQDVGIGPGDPEEEIDLQSISPKFHVKVLEVTGTVDLDTELDLPIRGEPILVRRSDEHQALVYVTRHVEQCRWSSDERLSDTHHDLFILFFDEDTGFLFVCSSQRDNSIYDAIVESVVQGSSRRLSPEEVNRVLRDLEHPSFFSVGMRSRAGFGNGESYRMIAGRSADEAIDRADGRFYDRGHCFGKGRDGGVEVTIGFSSASKIWANERGSLPALFKWCRRLAKKLSDQTAVVTRSGLDHLPLARHLEKYPDFIIASDWHERMFVNGITRLRISRSDGSTETFPLLDFGLTVVSRSEEEIVFIVVGHGISVRVSSRLGRNPMIKGIGLAPSVVVEEFQGQSGTGLVEFLNEYPPAFFTSGLERIQGAQISGAPRQGDDTFDRNNIETVDWVAAGIDPEKEKPGGVGVADSLFDWVKMRLAKSGADVIFNDDGAGEAADFIALRSLGEKSTQVELYHCKAATQRPVPGARIQDLYEVVGQAIKCSRITRAAGLREHLLRRVRDTSLGAGRLVVGTEADIESLLGDERSAGFTVFIVQPGIGAEPVRDQAVLLAAASAFLRSPQVSGLRVIGSVGT